MKCAILADDLTGACDTGIQFVDHGFGVQVGWHTDQVDSLSTDILSLSTNTRSLSPSAAASNTRLANAAIRQNARRLIYKKIDSTLRGNIGAEIDALLENDQYRLALVCPAIPRLGRRLVRGKLVIGDPYQTSDQHLPTLLRNQSIHDVIEIRVEDVRCGSDFLCDRLKRLTARGTTICCTDAENDTDLATLAESLMRLSLNILPVGSAGLAMHFAPRLAAKMIPELGQRPVSAPQQPEGSDLTRRSSASVVCFAGTTNSVTTGQLALLAKEFDVTSLKLDDETPRRLQLALDRDQHVVVQIEWAKGIKELLTNTIHTLENRECAGLVLTGGDTAQLVCDLAGVTRIELLRQLLLGLAKGRLVGGGLENTAVVTKAGGFGDQDALVKVLGDLTQSSRLTASHRRRLF